MDNSINNDSYENIFAEWHIKPIDEDEVPGNYYREEENVEEEVFPTSSMSHRVDEVKAEPVKIGPTVKKNKDLPPLPPGIENMMGSIFKMFGGENLGTKGDGRKETDDQEAEDYLDESNSSIKLKSLGCLLKAFALTIIAVLGWFMDKLRGRIPLGGAFDSVSKIISNDINRGSWNDMFNAPDEFLAGLLPISIYVVLDYFFGSVHYVVKHNRFFLPLLTFFMGLYMS